MADIYLDTYNRKIWGVCAGLAKKFGVSPAVVRIVVLVYILFTWEILLVGIVYTVLALVLKENYVQSNPIIEQNQETEEITFTPFDEDYFE